MEENNKFYTNDKSTLMLIGLLKSHGIKKIVISPGATNVCLVGSVQKDPYFELYSCVDERSAAYMACGLAEESGEPVALSCTGATASRNYLPGLTEAYYRKLPVLAITSMIPFGRVGHLYPQAIDRSSPLKDIVRISVQIASIESEEDEWIHNVNINKALLELKRAGGGPVHINLSTTFNPKFEVQKLPEVRVIERVNLGQKFPTIHGKRIAIFVGAHSVFSDRLVKNIEIFCEKYNAVVLCDHTSNYKGKYRILMNLVCDQKDYFAECRKMDLLIHIGNVSGAYASINPQEVWRVNPDGEIRDYFRKLRYVFEMEEEKFFNTFADAPMGDKETDYFEEWVVERNNLEKKIPELPFSNIWIAKKLSKELPVNSILYLGILNSLRSWNFFEIDKTIYSYANTGGFGIDGCVSTALGASLGAPEKLVFCVTGDLGFFYDMNACGNKHLANNLRILVINNGKGTEFRNYSHPAAAFGEDADKYMAAYGHFGKKSSELVKHYATDLCFEYIYASNKEEFNIKMKYFTSEDVLNKPIIFEVFTDSSEESNALYIMDHIEKSQSYMAKESAKKIVKGMLGEKGISLAKKMISKTK